MQIPAAIDLIQKTGKVLETPEIRVWCHPPKIGKSGDDYYKVFNSFAEAEEFAKTHKEAEKYPLVALKGFELNIYDIKPEL